MKRKAGQTRGEAAVEKRLMRWTKEQPCCICDNPGPSIVDHMYGSTFRHNKRLIGMIALLPYCQTCDDVKTSGNHNTHLRILGSTQAALWHDHIYRYMRQCDDVIEQADIDAVGDWGR